MPAPGDAMRYATSVTQHHAPTSDEALHSIGEIRAGARDFIYAILMNSRNNADRSAAIRKAREAMMTAIASIVVPDAGPLP